MNLVWVAREINLDCVNNIQQLDQIRKDLLIPFLRTILSSDIIVNWYTSYVAGKRYPNYRIYVRVEEEHESVINYMFKTFIDSNPEYLYMEENPVLPDNISNDDIMSIQMGSNVALQLMEQFPYTKDRQGTLWAYSMFVSLLYPIIFKNMKMIHFFSNNIGGNEISHLKGTYEMLVICKKIVISLLRTQSRLGRMLLWFKSKMSRRKRDE